MLVQCLQLAEVATKHHRNLADEDSCIILFEERLFDLSLAYAGLWAVVKEVFELLLTELDISIDLGGVRQASHTSLMWKHWLHAIVALHDAWRAVDVDLRELDLVHDVLVGVPLLPTSRVLRHLFNLNLAIF